MTAITALDTASRAELRARASGACVVYPHHPLPAGCLPATGRLGVEDNGVTILLHVDRAVRYTGGDAEVRAWVTSGTHAFGDFDTLLAWLGGKLVPSGRRTGLRDVLRDEAGPPVTDAPAAGSPDVDLDAVETDMDELPDAIAAAAIAAAITAEVVGQEDAIQVVSDAVAHHTAKVRPRRPLALLMFGPTGTGKTQLTEALANGLTTLSGKPWRVFRLDMNEFSERHTVARLHGAPPGYIGHGEATSLASELAAHPRSVIVFDEIDKAHPEVLNALMNLMDAGRLGTTDTGRPATAAILLFTANLEVPPGPDREHEARLAWIARGGRPEVVGRFRHLCEFVPLSGRDRATVAARTVERVAGDYGLTVAAIDPAYLTRVLRDTRQSAIGVRGLEYLVDAQLGGLLAAHRSGTTVRVTGAEPVVEAVDPLTDPSTDPPTNPPPVWPGGLPGDGDDGPVSLTK